MLKSSIFTLILPKLSPCGTAAERLQNGQCRKILHERNRQRGPNRMGPHFFRSDNNFSNKSRLKIGNIARYIPHSWAGAGLVQSGAGSPLRGEFDWLKSSSERAHLWFGEIQARYLNVLV